MRSGSEQSIGLWINEPLVAGSERLESSIDRLGEAGYDIVRLFVRNSNATHRSPEVVAAVGRAVTRIHRCRMRAVLDCEPHDLLSRDLIHRFPNAMATKLVRCTVRVVDGHWVLRVQPPSAGGGVGCWLEGIEAAFLADGGDFRRVQLDFTVSRGTQWYQTGHTHRELRYREGVAGAGLRREFELRGHLAAVTDAALTVYARFAVRNLVDFWSDGLTRYSDELLDLYRDTPLDGIAWDEPAADGDWASYRYGTAFANAFERLNGYPLADQLYLLDSNGMSAAAVKVRLDYYRTLNEGVAQAQKHLIHKARSLFGSDLLLGTHHTWQGEGAGTDYRAGAVDYFRLNDNMDAGYADCCWWDPEAVAYAYTLASSLGRLSPSGRCEVNSWHYAPTVSNVRTNVNLMTLMNVGWFNIWAGADADCVLQEGHYTWLETVAAMKRHRAYLQQIGSRRPVIDVAIWHGWEGICAWNQPGLAQAQKAFCLNTSRLFIERNIAADFIDSRLLNDSRAVDGRLVNAMGSYRVLIVPYALCLPRKAFDACASFARAGGRVVFVGTPVAMDERGESLASAFADLLGAPAMHAEHYMAGLDAVCTLPTHRPQRLEVCRPLPIGLRGGLTSCEGERHGVASVDGNVIFLTDLDPQQRLVDRIADVLPSEFEAFGDNLLWRRYRGAGPEMLVVIAKDDRPLRGLVRWSGTSFELSGGSVGLFELSEQGIRSEGDVLWKERLA
jgi:hypothetical protein